MRVELVQPIELAVPAFIAAPEFITPVALIAPLIVKAAKVGPSVVAKDKVARVTSGLKAPVLNVPPAALLRLLAVTPLARVVPVSVLAAAVTVMLAEPSNEVPLIVLGVARVAAVLAAIPAVLAAVILPFASTVIIGAKLALP